MTPDKQLTEKFKKFAKSDKKNVKIPDEIKINKDIIQELGPNSILANRKQMASLLNEQFQELMLEPVSTFLLTL